jgi:hypothetical protein
VLRRRQPEGNPEKVNVYEFAGKELGRANLYDVMFWPIMPGGSESAAMVLGFGASAEIAPCRMELHHFAFKQAHVIIYES